MPHVGSDNEVLGFFAIGIDVTERRALEERLRQAQKLQTIGQLAGGIAHEYNNLLQVVIGHVDMLIGDLSGDADIVARLNAVQRGAQHGAVLTKLLLSYSRRLPLASTVVDIAAALTEFQGMLRQTLGEAIKVKVRFQDGLWPAEVDSDQLAEALLNLSLNARDAMPNGGLVSIAAENRVMDELMASRYDGAVPGQYVVLSMTDDGAGMTADTLDRACEPFFTTKDIGQGAGLGLSMVYGFALQSRGFTELISEPEAGTTIRLYLPRVAAEAPDVMAHVPITESVKGRGVILLVEDDADVRELLAAHLSELGYRVIQAEDGAEAAAAAEHSDHIDLLLTDVVMPGHIDGIRLAQMLHAQRPGIRIIFMTGHSDVVFAEARELERNQTILKKPFALADLSAAIREVLAN